MSDLKLDIAKHNFKLCKEILRVEVGSTAHGVALPGNDDFDMMGIAIEHPAYILGADFEQMIYRTAEERTPAKDGQTPPSMPGDIDLVIYSLKKWARLAAQGNPTVLMCLYGPLVPGFTLDWQGETLRNCRRVFMSKNVGRRFLGYMTAQKERLLGIRGQMRTTRTELIAKHGYDTKYAMHVLRLGYQGISMMETGEMPVPLPAHVREALLEVRNGGLSLAQVVNYAEFFESQLKAALEQNKWPDQPNYASINTLVAKLYRQTWDEVRA